MADTTSQPKKTFLESLKDYIALSIVTFSFIVLIIIIIYAFQSASTDDTKFNHIKDVIGTILPVVGTWMGTILAFYFTKENFESASRSLQQTISRLTSEEKLKSTKVNEVMIEAGKIDKYPLKDGQTWDAVPIVEYINFLETVKRQRLVIFEGNNVKYVIHKSTLSSYVYNKLMAGVQKADIDKLTIADLLKDAPQDLKDYVTNTVDFISESATLFEAQQKMSSNPICQDVFVTSSGKNTDPIKGWITNVIITEKAQV